MKEKSDRIEGYMRQLTGDLRQSLFRLRACMVTLNCKGLLLMNLFSAMLSSGRFLEVDNLDTEIYLYKKPRINRGLCI